MEAHEGEATVLAHDDLIEPLLAVYDSSLHERAEMLILSDSWSEGSHEELLKNCEAYRLLYSEEASAQPVSS